MASLYQCLWKSVFVLNGHEGIGGCGVLSWTRPNCKTSRRTAGFWTPKKLSGKGSWVIWRLSQQAELWPLLKKERREAGGKGSEGWKEMERGGKSERADIPAPWVNAARHFSGNPSLPLQLKAPESTDKRKRETIRMLSVQLIKLWVRSGSVADISWNVVHGYLSNHFGYLRGST